MNLDARHLFTAVLLIAIFISPLSYAATPQVVAATPQVVPPAELKGTGFTAQQVRKSMLAQDSAARIAPKLRKLLGATFGGDWFDLSTGKAVVATTDPKEKNLILKHGATPVVVKNSFKKLNGIVQKLNRTWKGSPPPDGLIQEWGVDVKNNRVVMTISADFPLGLLKAQDYIRASGVNPNEVHIVKTKQALNRLLYEDVRGGDATTNVTYSTTCSVGFSIPGGYITAGHCGKVGNTVAGYDGNFQGNYEGSNWTDGGDGGWVATDSTWTPEPCVGVGSDRNCFDVFLPSQ